MTHLSFSEPECEINPKQLVFLIHFHLLGVGQ